MFPPGPSFAGGSGDAAVSGADVHDGSLPPKKVSQFNSQEKGAANAIRRYRRNVIA
jgi:hypothetical protein